MWYSCGRNCGSSSVDGLRVGGVKAASGVACWLFFVAEFFTCRLWLGAIWLRGDSGEQECSRLTSWLVSLRKSNALITPEKPLPLSCKTLGSLPGPLSSPLFVHLLTTVGIGRCGAAAAGVGSACGGDGGDSERAHLRGEPGVVSTATNAAVLDT